DVVERFGVCGVIFGGKRQVQEAFFEARVGDACIRAAAGATSDTEELLGGQVDLFVERGASHGLEQTSRGEEGVCLGAANFDAPRCLAGGKAPQAYAAGFGRG